MHLEHTRTMAAYNRWMNERLYATCEELDAGIERWAANLTEKRT